MEGDGGEACEIVQLPGLRDRLLVPIELRQLLQPAQAGRLVRHARHDGAEWEHQV